MKDTKTMTNKKTWTPPAIKSINLSSARLNPSHGPDGGGAHSHS